MKCRKTSKKSENKKKSDKNERKEKEIKRKRKEKKMGNLWVKIKNIFIECTIQLYKKTIMRKVWN